jgi:predicted PurR-regulated permease PerM
MTTSQLKYAVGILSDRQKFQEACQELRQHNFSLKNVAAISAREGAIKGAVVGGQTGGLLAFIVGLSAILVPLALAHAVIAGLLNFIPNVGPTLSVFLPMAIWIK